MKERHTISWDCFTSFSFLTPISLINLLLQQWVKEIVSVGFFSCRIEWQRSWQCVPCLLPGLGLRLDTAQCGPKRTKTAPRNSPHALQPRVRQSAVPEPEAVPRTIWVCKTQALGGAGRAPGMPSGLGAPPPPSLSENGRAQNPTAAEAQCPRPSAEENARATWAGAADPSFAPLWRAEWLSIKGDQG